MTSIEAIKRVDEMIGGCERALEALSAMLAPSPLSDAIGELVDDIATARADWVNDQRDALEEVLDDG